MRRSYPNLSCIVIVHKSDGHHVLKRIKNSARTAAIVSQHFARDPSLFVYRVNVHPHSPGREPLRRNSGTHRAKESN